MKLVYICSPLRGDMEANKKRASLYCAYAESCGVIPIAPHVAWSGVFDDTIPEKREAALRLGLEFLKRCDELWVMGNEITEGMQGEIDEATRLHKPKVYVLDEVVESNMKIRQRHEPLEARDVIPESDGQDYEGKILVVKPDSLSSRHRLSENSLWIASHGPGCMAGRQDRTVHAYNLFTGELEYFARYDFHGIVKAESLLRWLQDHPIRNEQAQAYVRENRATTKDLDMPYVNAYCNGEMMRLVPTAQNIASYIMTHGMGGDIKITTPWDTPVLNTFSIYINTCADKIFLEEKLKPVLISMQIGDAEPSEIEEYSGPDLPEDYEDELDGDMEP